MLKAHFQSLASLGVRGLSVLAGFLVTLFIGRFFGPEASGHYALITQTGMFLSIVAVGGVDLAVTRTFSATIARGTGLERKTLFKVIFYSLFFAAVLLLLLAMIGTSALRLLTQGTITQGALTTIAIIMISRALTRITSAILRSQRAYIWGQSIEVLIIPVIVVLLMLAGIIKTVEAAIWYTAIVGIITGIVGVFSCMRYTEPRGAGLHIPMRDILKIAGPLWGVAIFLNLSDWYGLATTSAILSVHDAGLYRVAAQVASALSIISLGLFSVFSPQFGAAAASDDMARVARLAATATRLSAIFALPIAIIIFIFAEPILQMFGPEFASARTILRIAAAGQAIFAMTGLSGLVLAMTGHERTNLILAISSAATLLITAPLAAYWGGLTGITLCMACVMVGRNIASLYYARRLTGIMVLTGHYRPVQST